MKTYIHQWWVCTPTVDIHLNDITSWEQALQRTFPPDHQLEERIFVWCATRSKELYETQIAKANASQTQNSVEP